MEENIDKLKRLINNVYDRVFQNGLEEDEVFNLYDILRGFADGDFEEEKEDA